MKKVNYTSCVKCGVEFLPSCMRESHCSLHCKMEAHTDRSPGHGPDGTCHLWTGSHRNGYGAVWTDGKMHRAHRVAFQFYKRQEPGQLCVCHTCDTSACVNPEHLFLDTSAGNNADRDRKGRQKTPTGERNGNSKLSNAEVVQIRDLCSLEGITQTQVAEMFGIATSHVSRLVKGKCRTDV